MNRRQINLKANYVIRNYLQPGFIFQNLFIPSTLVLFYSGSFALLSSLLSSFLFLKNVNYCFSLDMARFSLLISLLALAALVILRVISPHPSPASPPRLRGSTGSLWIALLPLASVNRYLLVNEDILSLLDVVVILAACLGCSIVLVVAIPALLSRYSPTRLLASIAGAFVFTIINMATISDLLHWLGEGSTKIQLPLFVLTLGIIWLLLGLKNTHDLAFVVVAFLVSSVALQFLTQSKSSSDERTLDVYRENRLADLVAGRLPTRTPNVYLLVYDSYAPNETLLSYGIDNSDQEGFLVEQGFTLYPRTYSVGGETLSSMNRVFNVSLEHDGHSRKGVSGDGIVHELLRSLGYRVLGIFENDYMFRNASPRYDYYTPQNIMPSYQLLLSAIGMGEFRFDIGLQTIGHEEYVLAKREVFAAPGESPLFVYTHAELPNHSQNSGTCLKNETELYAERLRKANTEMRQDIAAIITSDPDAMIIVAGDHGPYLTKNCTALNNHYDPADITRADIQDRYGVFLAVRWPAEDRGEYDRITVLQDIFPAIFAWMYRDSALLEARIEPITVNTGATGRVGVRDGVISGGADDGQPLFLSGE